MRFITAAEISKFRSIDTVSLPELGDFSVLAGLNNSGKSNVLRALHLFFTNEVEPGLPIVFARDFYRPDLPSKKRKRISVRLTFSLPSTFKFRAGLEPSKALLGTNFTVRKEWSPEGEAPDLYLNESVSALSLEDSRKVENFLRLVSVRYIPNRVIPTDLIGREHQALRDVLVRRLSQQQGQSAKLFEAIKRTSEELLADLSAQMKAAAPELDAVSLSTAQSLADLAFKFGYQLLEGKSQTSEHEQGSGIQSLLMFRTLSLIDQDYFKQFGWKQASLWLVEEPESSLHTALEAQVAFFLKELTTRKDGRLQAVATTHSDLQIQYSTTSYLIAKEQKDGKASSSAAHMDQRDLLNASAKFGISRWVDPILYFPLDPLVLVEGKFDRDFIASCNEALGIKPSYRVFTLEDLLQDPAKGGIETLIHYVKERSAAIRIRPPSAGVVLLADWDASNKGGALSSTFKASDPFKFLAWDVKEANPQLDSTFRGIERFMSTDHVDQASQLCGGCVGKKANGVRMVASSDFTQLKKTLNSLITSGISAKHAEHATHMLSRLNALTGV